MGELEKFGNSAAIVSAERRRMLDALVRLGEAEAKATAAPAPAKTGRLIFALDLTQSREHSLRAARAATAAMFEAVRAIGHIAVKLVYYRGTGTCRATGWETDPELLSRHMSKLSCEAGATQIARVLRLALAEAGDDLGGVVFIGDHNEDFPAELATLATALGEKKLPLFVFHECADNDARALQSKPLFKRLAELSGGVYCEFKPDSGGVLRELLSTVAAFTTGGTEGVRQLGSGTGIEARQLQSRLLLLGRGAPVAEKRGERR